LRALSKSLLLAAALAGPVAALGRPPNPSQGRHFVAQQQDGPSLSEAVEMVRRQYHGRIVSAKTQMNGKREVHVIRVMTEDGKVRTVHIPGRTHRS
jgi:hypothetical protein